MLPFTGGYKNSNNYFPKEKLLMKKGAKFEAKQINIYQVMTFFLTTVKDYKLMPGKLGRFYPVVKGLKEKGV